MLQNCGKRRALLGKHILIKGNGEYVVTEGDNIKSDVLQSCLEVPHPGPGGGGGGGGGGQAT